MNPAAAVCLPPAPRWAPQRRAGTTPPPPGRTSAFSPPQPVWPREAARARLLAGGGESARQRPATYSCATDTGRAAIRFTTRADRPARRGTYVRHPRIPGPARAAVPASATAASAWAETGQTLTVAADFPTGTIRTGPPGRAGAGSRRMFHCATGRLCGNNGATLDRAARADASPVTTESAVATSIAPTAASASAGGPTRVMPSAAAGTG